MEINRTENNQTEMRGVTEYEPQYDANNDFAIFNVGNPKTGGL